MDYQNDLFCRIDDSRFRDEGESIVETTYRFFRVIN